MLCPSKGPSSGKHPTKQFDKESKVFKVLGTDGMILFKKFITENNNKSLRDRYFSHPFIRKIWPAIRQYISEDLLFKNGL
jgi:hypothetical protein